MVDELRTSRCGVVHYRDDGVVWDDYVRHRQLGLPAGSEGILREFRDWQGLGGWSTKDLAMIELLRSGEILIERGSEQHRAEQALLDAWSPWSSLTTAYHLSSAFSSGEKALTQRESDIMLHDKISTAPPPSVHYAHPRAESSTPLPPAGTLPSRTDGRFMELLGLRRSMRDFGEKSIEMATLGGVLSALAIPDWASDKTQTALKKVPSGGGRHPTELYLYARDVAGISAGVYHLNTGDASLERLNGAVDAVHLVSVCNEQDWVSDAQALVFYTSRIDRNQWKYSHSRSYRVLHYDVGHFAQTVALALVDVGLVSTFTAALRDDLAMELLSIEDPSELIMGCTVIGTSRDDA